MGLYISVLEVSLISKPNTSTKTPPIILQLAPESSIVLTGTLLISQDKNSHRDALL